MQIDRSNYEIWLIDWLDGNLNSLQIEQVKLFLEQNYDIREEFSNFAPVNLSASGIPFRHKEQLKKSPSDFTPAQFEYLCTAYFENDLTNDQQEELLKIVNRYPDRKQTFDLIHKTKLTPDRIKYKHKNLILKRTTFQNVLRFSVIGLSTAAAISIIIITFFSPPATSSLKINTSAHNMVSDSMLRRSSSVKTTNRIFTDSILVNAEKKRDNRFVNIHKKANGVANNKLIIPAIDSLVRISDNKKMIISKVPVCPQIEVGEGVVTNTIISYNPEIIIPDVEDERSEAGKFISKTFRNKFLKGKTPPDSPLKGYEIAQAGISGLNKLFGWQIVLDMKNDENGQPKSVYFSSKALKVNAPLKKRESQP